jgi:hypothetical protein
VWRGATKSHRLVLIEPLTKNEPQRWLGEFLQLIFGKPAVG